MGSRILILFNNRAIVLHQGEGGQCSWAGRE